VPNASCVSSSEPYSSKFRSTGPLPPFCDLDLGRRFPRRTTRLLDILQTMATESEKPADSESAQQNDDKPSKGMMGKLHIGGIIAAVVAVECLLAYFLIPSAADMQPSSVDVTVEETEDAETAADESAATEVEVDLGDFAITSLQRGTNTTLRIDFQLIGIVHQDDEAELTELYGRCENRMRDKVIVTIRSSEIEDLSDAGLALIKRRILERTNAALGKPIVRRVIFSRFSLIEQ